MLTHPHAPFRASTAAVLCILVDLLYIQERVRRARKQRLLYLEVGRGARKGLHIHSPLLRIKAKRCKSALLAEPLCLVYELVATIVASAWVAL